MDNSESSEAWNLALNQWAQWLLAAQRSPATVTLRKYHVARFATFTPSSTPGQATEQQIIAFLSACTWSASTRRSYRSSLIQFYNWAVGYGISATNPTRNLLPIKRTPPVPRPAPDHVILEAIHRSSPRERLMLLLASEAGLRRCEISRAHTDDIVGEPRARSLVVHGKGSKERLVPIAPRLELELNGYLERIKEGWLFPTPRATGPIGAIRVGELPLQRRPSWLLGESRPKCWQPKLE